MVRKGDKQTPGCPVTLREGCRLGSQEQLHIQTSSKKYLGVQDWQKDTYRCKVGIRYLQVQGWQKILKGPRLAKGTYRSKVGKRYLKVQGWQKVPKGPRFEKDT